LYLLSDVITYVRRIIKSPSNSVITDNLIIDYINRFYTSDVDARIQLFDLKTTYEFQTIPGIDQYNLPLYSVQTESGGQQINLYPVYQGLSPYAAVNGIQVPFYTQKEAFYSIWPNYVQALNPAAIGDGTNSYTISLPFFPAIPGHVDMQGVIKAGSPQGSLYASSTDPMFLDSSDLIEAISTIPTTSIRSGVYFTATDIDGQNIVVADTGLFLNDSLNSSGELYGALMAPGKAPLGNAALAGGYSTVLNTVNYTTGVANVTFPSSVPAGNPINAQCYFYEQGLPRALLYYNNVLTLRNPPSIQYLISLEGYLSPAAFLASTDAVPFAYMAEYIARGAARKILADTGDMEQFQFYEPFFKEQETLVWKRSQRIVTSSRTQTIFSESGVGNLSTNTTQGGT
jgi:hypothetical protein